MTENIDKVFSEQVIDIIECSRDFCLLLENNSKEKKSVFLAKVQNNLSSIYDGMIKLPEFESVIEDANEKFVTETEWNFIKENSSTKLTKHDIFLELYVPVQQREMDTTSISLSEVFADIYQDLRDMLELYRIGDEKIMNDALWELKLNFEQYWGQRLLIALTAIHNIIYSEENIDEE